MIVIMIMLSRGGGVGHGGSLLRREPPHTPGHLRRRVRSGGLPASAPPGWQRKGPDVSTSADHAAQRGLAERLGIEPGMVVQVVGSDDDVDASLTEDVAARVGTELITTDDSDEVVDVVLIWWREGDGDLVDALVDALTNLGDSGVVWLLTPKAGRDGHVEPSDIDEAAPTAGLSSTRSTSAAPEWSGTRLVSPKASRAKQRR